MNDYVISAIKHLFSFVLTEKARVILFTVWHQICSAPKITGVLTALKKNKKSDHSGISLWYGAAARAVQDSSSRCSLDRIHHTETDSCARALTSGHLCRYDMPAPLWSYTTYRILHNYNSTYIRSISGRWQKHSRKESSHDRWPTCNPFSSQCVITDLNTRTRYGIIIIIIIIIIILKTWRLHCNHFIVQYFNLTTTHGLLAAQKKTDNSKFSAMGHLQGEWSV